MHIIQPRPQVLLMPQMALPYMTMLCSQLRKHGCTVVNVSKLPRRRILWGDKFDAVHLHMLDHVFANKNPKLRLLRMIEFALFWAPVLRSRNIRLIWTCHELEPHEQASRRYALLCSKIMSFIAEHIWVHNNHMREDVRHRLWVRSKTQVEVIPHGNMSEHFSDQEPPSTKTACSDHFVFGVLGYMRENKGTDLIIRAFRSLAHKQCKLLIAGDCEDPAFADKLRSLCEGDSRIEMQFGRLEDSQLASLHKECNVIVFAFRECPTSGSLLTAISLGRPVICPALGHAGELADERIGWFFEPGEMIEPMVQAMNEALRDPLECTRRGAEGLKRMRDQDWSTITGRYIDHYIINQAHAYRPDQL